ncbi:PucR family transcriptional regulator [Yinghuangia soli]|uniref:Helix-turn-helix domain-containing protein n=1 Tax=Yinghuangia soli TaxID=2908204 RepID=A0AA41Q9F6_9ACTN|nr:PucR family transcriptional regulator [Yinghuangia soli]MCF2533873.1 helix-turn-helix domain-containing protein [Yinghuangia soli]
MAISPRRAAVQRIGPAQPHADNPAPPLIPAHVEELATAAVPAPCGALEHAAELLRGHAAVIAERAAARLLDEITYYGNPMLVPADLADSAHLALETAIESLASPGRFTDSGAYAWQLGARRAAEGVPLLVLLHSYRIGAALLWESLVEASLRDAPDQAQQMIYAAADYWRYIDRDTTLLIAGHRRGQAALPADEGRKRLPVLKALLRGHSDPVDVSAASVALELPLTGRYAVARLEGARPRAADAALLGEVEGIAMHWCPYDEGQVVVALLEDHSLEEFATVLELSSFARCGVGSVVGGLAELGRARELAELAMRACRRDGELVLFDRRMSAGFMISRPDLAGAIARRVLGPVLDLDDADRTLLLNTLEAWLDCDGSNDRAGALLYCHRNTVLNRMHRLERLTGRSLDRPRDLVDLALALEAHRLVGPTRHSDAPRRVGSHLRAAGPSGDE